MPPLTRYESLPSVHSWWSDSNPPGPTISLHAAAKPLMRFLYLRQARDLIRDNAGGKLSREVMEDFVSYLAYKYISPSTKVLVLREVDRRLDIPEDTPIIVEVLLQRGAVIVDLLSCASSPICQAACEVLAKLVARPSAFSSLAASRKYCVPIHRSLGDKDVDRSRAAIFALSKITLSVEGVVIAVDMHLQDNAAELLYSDDRKIQEYSWVVLCNIQALHSPTALTVDPWPHMIRLLSFEDTSLRLSILSTLSSMLRRWQADVAMSVVDAGIVNLALELLKSSSVTNIRDSADSLLRELARNETVSVAVCADFLQSLGDCVRNKPSIPSSASLREMTGLAEALFDGRTFLEVMNGKPNVYEQLLVSNNTDLQQWACKIISRVSQAHSKDPKIVVSVEFLPRIIDLLSTDEHDVYESALAAISELMERRGAAGSMHGGPNKHWIISHIS